MKLSNCLPQNTDGSEEQVCQRNMSFLLELIKTKCYKPQAVFVFLIIIMSLTLFFQFTQKKAPEGAFGCISALKCV